jgi:tetratricopeptide (TPR) repeat protein
MSVLYKALQKAAKDNERHQAPTVPFDAERLAGSGVIRTAGGRRVSWRIAGAAISIVFIAAMGAAFYLTSSDSQPPPKLQIATAPRGIPPSAPQVTPPPPSAAPAPSTAGAPPTVAGTGAAPSTQLPASQPPVAVTVTPTSPTASQVAAAAPPPVAADESAADTSETPDASAAGPSVSGYSKARVAPVSRTVARQQPMPDIDPNSPARMLNPPITIHRNQIDLEGVGNAVQVRRVSAYNALIRGEYDTALGFYDEALKQEPTSVLALLGRGTALQKLGRKDEARKSYDRVLKINPGNREALTNLTGLESERAPGEALARLMDLEKEYPNFSPVKAQIALIYARLENFDGALEYFRRALVVTPDAPLYLYNMALVLDRLGKSEQAVAYYERTLSMTVGGRAIPELSVPDIQRRITFLRAK